MVIGRIGSIEAIYPNANQIHNSSVAKVASISKDLGVEPAIANKGHGSEQFAFESFKSVLAGRNFEGKA
ncbi:MAG TPA: hypothetical protein PLD27_03680 [bacterium]|nr:hypothetical protein [bacterium]HOL47864.1 hypothetical protein [bacterium]HPQ17903.1 hypothetical protein [bacterium]